MFSAINRRLLEPDFLALMISTAPKILKPEAISEEAIQYGSTELLLPHQVYRHVQNVSYFIFWEIFISKSTAFYISNHRDAASASSLAMVANDVRPSVTETHNCVSVVRLTFKFDARSSPATITRNTRYSKIPFIVHLTFTSQQIGYS